MQVFEKNPFKITAISEPSLDKYFIYIKLRIDTKKNPKLMKPGISPGGEFILNYKERIEIESYRGEDAILLVDGDLSWANRMGTYKVKDKDDTMKVFKEKRLSELGSDLDEKEISKKLRLYVTDVYNLWHESKKS